MKKNIEILKLSEIHSLKNTRDTLFIKNFENLEK